MDKIKTEVYTTKIPLPDIILKGDWYGIVYAIKTVDYYNTEKIDDLKDFFTVSFVLIDDVYNEIIPSSIKNRRNISKSKFSDSEIITISIVGEALTINSEKAWFYF